MIRKVLSSVDDCFSRYEKKIILNSKREPGDKNLVVNIGSQKIAITTTFFGEQFTEMFWEFFSKNLAKFDADFYIVTDQNIDPKLANVHIIKNSIESLLAGSPFEALGGTKSQFFAAKLRSFEDLAKSLAMTKRADALFWVDGDAYLKSFLVDSLRKLPRSPLYGTWGHLGRSVISSGFFGFDLQEQVILSKDRKFFSDLLRVNYFRKYFRMHRMSKHGDQILLQLYFSSNSIDLQILPYQKFNNWYDDEWDQKTSVFHLAKNARRKALSDKNHFFEKWAE